MTATVIGFCSWLESTALSQVVQTVGWIIPTVQTVHILCVAILFSSAVLVDLRLLGLLGCDVPQPELARRYLPTTWPVLLVLLLTGIVLIVGEPRRSLVNSTFYIKMALLAVAIVITRGLQWSLTVSSNFWELNAARRAAGRIAAGCSILVWSGMRGAGADKLGLPSAVRGMPGVLNFSHCAWAGDDEQSAITIAAAAMAENR